MSHVDAARSVVQSIRSDASHKVSRGRLATSGSPVPAVRFNHTPPDRDSTAPTKEDGWFASERRKLVRNAQKVAEDFKSNVFLIGRRNGRLYLYTSEPRNVEWPPGPQDIVGSKRNTSSMEQKANASRPDKLPCLPRDCWFALMLLKGEYLDVHVGCNTLAQHISSITPGSILAGIFQQGGLCFFWQRGGPKFRHDPALWIEFMKQLGEASLATSTAQPQGSIHQPALSDAPPQKLPPELWIVVICHLDNASDLLRSSLVSRAFYAYIDTICEKWVCEAYPFLKPYRSQAIPWRVVWALISTPDYDSLEDGSMPLCADSLPEAESEAGKPPKVSISPTPAGFAQSLASARSVLRHVTARSEGLPSLVLMPHASRHCPVLALVPIPYPVDKVASMCPYKQVKYRCLHSRYLVVDWCQEYAKTEVKCHPVVYYIAKRVWRDGGLDHLHKRGDPLAPNFVPECDFVGDRRWMSFFIETQDGPIFRELSMHILVRQVLVREGDPSSWPYTIKEGPEAGQVRKHDMPNWACVSVGSARKAVYKHLIQNAAYWAKHRSFHTEELYRWRFQLVEDAELSPSPGGSDLVLPIVLASRILYAAFMEEHDIRHGQQHPELVQERGGAAQPRYSLPGEVEHVRKSMESAIRIFKEAIKQHKITLEAVFQAATPEGRAYLGKCEALPNDARYELGRPREIWLSA
ncbi:uncharacterized protein B0I36DRAFT_355881 [Microdochium trichocladiopsis]|uniref:F-box domain-containing protein n=1 Tax=Microdochium trichocladiopsis TaxID=1682393 RepID=A0A9P9BIN5_9PEZI|nr:uncharacterized protein B0I36DRAFT_355881 [Microdochium trichocladiopsis]KAH7012473.1 hypothetical protein B0I36DRAFT_355881 [Microdochium trichocladiopsis]